MDEKSLAEVILEAQRIREDSFDKMAAAREKRLFAMNRASEFMNRASEFIDADRFYGKTLYEAADEATSKAGFGLRILQLVFILLGHSWDDIRLWAKTVLNVDDEAA